MKTVGSKIAVIGGGFLLAMCLHIFVRCEKYIDGGGDNPIIVDMELDIKGMEDAASEAETAFLSGDPDQVYELLSDDSKTVFGERVEHMKADVLISLGQAMHDRQHTVKSSTYAEFEFSDEGLIYSIAFTRVGKNSWKLVRF